MERVVDMVFIDTVPLAPKDTEAEVSLLSLYIIIIIYIYISCSPQMCLFWVKLGVPHSCAKCT